MANEDTSRMLREVPAERVLDAARATARDPGAPLRPGRKEQLLLAGFVMCLVVAVVTVVLPELSDGDAAHKQPLSARAPEGALRQAAPSR